MLPPSSLPLSECSTSRRRSRERRPSLLHRTNVLPSPRLASPSPCLAESISRHCSCFFASALSLPARLARRSVAPLAPCPSLVLAPPVRPPATSPSLFILAPISLAASWPRSHHCRGVAAGYLCKGRRRSHRIAQRIRRPAKPNLPLSPSPPSLSPLSHPRPWHLTASCNHIALLVLHPPRAIVPSLIAETDDKCLELCAPRCIAIGCTCAACSCSIDPYARAQCAAVGSNSNSLDGSVWRSREIPSVRGTSRDASRTVARTARPRLAAREESSCRPTRPAAREGGASKREPSLVPS